MRFTSLLFLYMATWSSIGATYLDKHSIFPYSNEFYREICNPKVVSEIDNFSYHKIFSDFYTKLRVEKSDNLNELTIEFNNYKHEMEKYLEELNWIQQLFQEGRLDNNSKLYFRKRLHHFGLRLIDMIQNQDHKIPVLQQQSLQNVQQDNFVNFQQTGQTNIQRIFENMYDSKFNKIDNHKFFVDEALEFADSEIERDQDYFKEELCALKHLIPHVVDFYTKKGLSGNSQGENLKLLQKETLQEFIGKYIQFDDRNFQCFENPQELWMQILKIIIDEHHGDQIDQIKNKHPHDQFDEDKIDEIIRVLDDPESAKIMKRDSTIYHFGEDKFNLEGFSTLRNVPHHFSSYFIAFLDYVPKFDIIKSKKIQTPEQGLVISELLYALYTEARLIGLIDLDTPTDVPTILSILLGYLEEDSFKLIEQNELPEDPEDNLPELADRDQLRLHYPQILLLIRYFLFGEGPEEVKEIIPIQPAEIDIDEDDLDNDKIIEKVLDIGGEPSLDNLIDDLIDEDDNDKKKLVKKAQQQNIENNLANLKLIELPEDILPSLDDPLNNEDDDDDSPIDPQIPLEKIQDLPASKEMDKTLKRIDKIVDDLPEKKKKKQIKEITLSLLELIDQDDDKKNYLWITIFLNAVQDKNKFKNGKLLRDELNKKIIKEMIAKAGSMKGFMSLLEFKIQKNSSIYHNIFNHEKSYDSVNFDVMDEQHRKLYNKKLHSLMLADVTFFYLKVNQNPKDLPRESMNFYHRFEQSNFKETYTKFRKSFFLIKNYHSIRFFYEFLHFFQLFDHVNSAIDKSVQHTPQEQKVLGELFFEIYHMLMNIRMRLNSHVPHPISSTLKHVERCIETTFVREGQQQLKQYKTSCPNDYKVYVNMHNFLKYYTILNEEDKTQFHNSIMNNSQKNSPEHPMMYVDTVPFLAYMRRIPESYPTMNEICSVEKVEDYQLCVEDNIVDQLMEFPIENIEMNVMRQIHESYPVIKEKKYIFWNVLEYMNKMSSFRYESLMRKYDDIGNESTDVNQFQQLMNYSDAENEKYVASYLRLNFGSYERSFETIIGAVTGILAQNKLDECLTGLHKFTYNNLHEDVRIQFMNNIVPFVFFAQNDVNYIQVGQKLKNHGWLIPLYKTFYNNEKHILHELQSDLNKDPSKDKANVLLNLLKARNHFEINEEGIQIKDKYADFGDESEEYSDLDSEDFDDSDNESINIEKANKINVVQDDSDNQFYDQNDDYLGGNLDLFNQEGLIENTEYGKDKVESKEFRDKLVMKEDAEILKEFQERYQEFYQGFSEHKTNKDQMNFFTAHSQKFTTEIGKKTMKMIEEALKSGKKIQLQESLVREVKPEDNLLI